MKHETVRTFVCLEIPDAEQARVERLCDPLRSHGARITWVARGNLHLTLAFLGDTEVARIPEISRMVTEVAGRDSVFELRLAGVGAFPGLSRPRVLWAGLDGDLRALESLRSEIVTALRGVGVAFDDKPFRPHLTIGRVKNPRDPALDRVRQALVGAELEGERFVVDDVVVMRSELLPTGARYSALSRAPLSPTFPSSPGPQS